MYIGLHWIICIGDALFQHLSAILRWLDNHIQSLPHRVGMLGDVRHQKRLDYIWPHLATSMASCGMLRVFNEFH